MNTLYITNTGKVEVNEKGEVNNFESTRQAIDYIIRLKEDTKVVYNKGEKTATLEGKAGDIIITFYEKDFPNPMIVINNDKWTENIDTYEANEQKRKEEWAAKKLCCEDCGEAC